MYRSLTIPLAKCSDLLSLGFSYCWKDLPPTPLESCPTSLLVFLHWTWVCPVGSHSKSFSVLVLGSFWVSRLHICFSLGGALSWAPGRGCFRGQRGYGWIMSFLSCLLSVQLEITQLITESPKLVSDPARCPPSIPHLADFQRQMQDSKLTQLYSTCVSTC